MSDYTIYKNLTISCFLLRGYIFFRMHFSRILHDVASACLSQARRAPPRCRCRRRSVPSCALSSARARKVAMPAGLAAWVQSFTDAHYVEEQFVKRKRRKHMDAKQQDGIGDPRISTEGDVYASPALKRGRLT